MRLRCRWPFWPLAFSPPAFSALGGSAAPGAAAFEALIFLEAAAAAVVQSSDSEAEVSVEELGDAAAWSGFRPRRMARSRCFWPESRIESQKEYQRNLVQIILKF